jgi:TolA-binding protein
LQQFGNSELADIDPLIQSQQYAVAIQKLRDISNAFAGTPVAASAKTKLNELGSNPKVKATLEAAKTEKEAADALAIAKQLKTAKKDDLAYAQFKTVVKGYPRTTAAAEAAVVVKAYESNTAFMTAFNNKANSKKAESLLQLADNYRQMGSSDKAREKYQQVLDQFPGTAWADSAKKGIAAIGDGQ